MSRSINLNLIALDIQKNIELTVNEDNTLADISQFLTEMFTNCDSSSFKYRETDDEKELPLEGNTIIKNLVRGNEEELTLYVETDKKRKKDDVCCVIY